MAKVRAFEKWQKKKDAEKVIGQQEKVINQGIVERNLFKAQLKEWYDGRRDEYFKNRMDSNATAAARRAILAYRNRDKTIAREEARKKRDLMQRKMEDNKIADFVKRWELIIEMRVKDRGEVCRRSLLIPESPEEQTLQGVLNGKIKKHTKVVLWVPPILKCMGNVYR